MVGSCDDKEGEVVAVLVGGAQVIVLAASSSVLTTGWGCATRACFADSKCALRSVMLPLVPPGSPDRHASVPPWRKKCCVCSCRHASCGPHSCPQDRGMHCQTRRCSG